MATGKLVLFMLLSSCFAHRYHSYAQTCPSAESIVQQTVRSHFNSDNTIVAGVLRLHFHDCFVNGCDGSVLLDSTPTDGTNVERFAAPNNNSARGFEVINDAKQQIEAVCPGVVSCADTLAFAARDASVLLGGMSYNVPSGRFDGRVSNLTLANSNLPSPFWNVSLLKENFARKGLSVQDLVLLSGGHTIGRSQCRFFENRIYNFSGTGQPDPTLNSSYLLQLRTICTPQGASPSPRTSLDKGSEFNFDNSYYKNLATNNGLLTSDQVLAGSSETSSLVTRLSQDSQQFFQQFAQSMINMGNIEWKTSANGEIRKKCSEVNPTISSDASAGGAAATS